MATTREIRRRIRGVKNISQVTRALEAVSAARVRRAQSAVLASRPYAEKAWEVLTHLSNQAVPGALLHPLLQVRPEIRRVGLVLITGDRGLAGAFTSNMVRATMDYIRNREVPIRMIAVGRKGRDLMYRRGQRIIAEFSRMPAAPSILDVTPIARTALDEFLSGEVDEVVLAYTDFVSTLTQRPTIKRLLPILPGDVGLRATEAYLRADGRRTGPTMEYLYEPSPEGILDSLLPRLTETQIYQAVLESQASEHSARMVAMRNATENANALVDELTLRLNKARQQSITSELLDIAGGAEALARARGQRVAARAESGRERSFEEVLAGYSRQSGMPE
jgi:F-type H+-transporting ATPase subunit gamma